MEQYETKKIKRKLGKYLVLHYCLYHLQFCQE